MTTLSSERWLPRNFRPEPVAADGVVIGIPPDPETNRDALALSKMAKLGFRLSGISGDAREMYFRRFTVQFADLALLRTGPGEPCRAEPYPREGFPWEREIWPSPQMGIEDLFFETILQLAEWSSS
ncbi:hypothetical protein [Amycolatopsis rubida]|uniref:Uncharacterized protein n=1 Tax=Amycolatopsis rubida TaxID=112413 RepID=A0A1I5XBI8_9PSEU|nr:hypothetical protein [Amycolatopsis rubida]SFQ29335.1 hypothetical protein SAMN05421854_110140 [Amycolatopsis rubida]